MALRRPTPAATLDDHLITLAEAYLLTGRRRGTDAQRIALTGTALFDGLEFYATDTKWTWIYSSALGKWRPWDSPWVAFTATFANWSFGAGSSQSCRYRWDAGYVHYETYIQAFSASNTDQLVISAPEPIKFDYNIVKSPSIDGARTHVYDNGSGTDFFGEVRPNREYAFGGLGGGANPQSLIPKVTNLQTNGYSKILGIGSGTPFTASGIPNGSQVWTASRYESANYPFS